MTRSLIGYWALAAGEALLGTIDVSVGDFPWLSGSWLPAPAFAKVAPLFERELALVNDVYQW